MSNLWTEAQLSDVLVDGIVACLDCDYGEEVSDASSWTPDVMGNSVHGLTLKLANGQEFQIEVKQVAGPWPGDDE